MPAKEEQEKLYNDWLLNGTRLHSPNGGIYMNPEIINDPLVKM